MTGNSVFIFITGLIFGAALCFFLIDSKSIKTQLSFQPKEQSITLLHMDSRGDVLSKSSIDYSVEGYQIEILEKNNDFHVIPIPLLKTTVIEFGNGKILKKESKPAP